MSDETETQPPIERAEPTRVLTPSLPLAPQEPLEDTPQAVRSERVRIGSQRPGPAPAAPPKPVAPKPSTQIAPRQPNRPQPQEKVAPPSVRGRLSEDLEMEFVEALGGTSVDELLRAAAPATAGAELAPETRVSGRVMSAHRDSLFIDLGAGRQGALSMRPLTSVPELGQMVDVVVARFDATEGMYELILPGGAVSVEDWSELSDGVVVEARIVGHNKGGLECEVSRIRGFIPAGQVSLYRVEDLAQFVGQRWACVVTEANSDRRNLVLSRRAVLERLQAEAKEALMAQLEVGETREGVVRSLQEFGAFVDLGGVDGLIHISQLSWDRVKHASEVLQVGQTIKVRIQKIDTATGRIGLGFRDLSENPWQRAAAKYPTRSQVSGVVTRLMDFGAFVRLEPGVEGLVHISELAHKRVFRVSDIVQEGQAVEVLVLSVDPEQQRMSLSLKALAARPELERKPEPEVEEAPPPPRRASNAPLKGGLGKSAGGDQFGLTW